jgi:hypothetical protein
MSYIDAPNIYEAKVGMPLRAWWWGENDALLKAHAAEFPWEDRPYDDLMIEYFDKKSRGEVIVGSMPIYKQPVVETVKAAVAPVSKPKAEPMNQKQRGLIGRKLLDDFIEKNKGNTIVAADLLDIVDSLGLTRPWITLQLNDYVTRELIVKHKKDRSVTWEILPNSEAEKDSRSE